MYYGLLTWLAVILTMTNDFALAGTVRLAVSHVTAIPTPLPAIVDLDGTPTRVTRIFGDDTGDFSSYSVSSGDVNGEGFTDVIIGAYQADPAGGNNAGETYVIYGGTNRQTSFSGLNLIVTPKIGDNLRPPM